MPDVVMPRLSDSMEEGTIVRWLRASGDEIEPGAELVEIETDKANVVYEADTAGVLEIVAPEGATLPIGEPIACLGDGSAPAAARPAAAARADDDGGGRVKASPVARRLARQLEVDLAAVAGSGPGGRIVKADVERAAGAAAAAASTGAGAAAPQPTAPAPRRPDPVVSGEAGGGKGETTAIELTRTQQVIARRMAESKATIPDYAVAVEVDMAAAAALRDQLKEASSQERPAPSFNDMVVKAAALALRDHPKVNGAFADGRWELHARVNVGIAVATDDALIVPTVFDADGKALGEIAREARTLAQRVRAGQITPPELSGATFTVSNLGMFGVSEFTAIVTSGQAAILSVGALRDVPVVSDGRIVPGRRMTLTLSADHRILNGAEAARFAARVRELLEAPLSLAF